MLEDRFQHDDYGKTDRIAKRTTRAGKREHFESLASQTANKDEQGRIYKITKLICGKYTGAPNVNQQKMGLQQKLSMTLISTQNHPKKMRLY